MIARLVRAAGDRPPARQVLGALGVIALFAALTTVMTWPQARVLGSQATPHEDVFFNMWRLRWIAHALVTPSARFFDANIFTPEQRTLALSDAMPLEGVAAAPLAWAGVRPVLVHNLVLLGGIVLSGAAMFGLVRYLTASRAAGVIAGIVFAFAPYRFSHYMHMELQWTVWMPLAFLAMHRTFDTGRWRYGIATGACLALQMLSSIYYGIFLATLLPIGALLLLARDGAAPRRKVLLSLAAGAAVAIVVSGLYARPYLATHAMVGDRGEGDVLRFSARASSYRAVTPNNWLYGGRHAGVGEERRLFPGVIPLVLAAVALLLRVPGARPITYLLLMVTAFELSLGMRGYSYRLLQDYLALYRGLRALGRLGVFVLMFLAVLAGYGYAAIVEGRSRAVRIGLAAAVAAGLLAEYRVTLNLQPFQNTPPPIYRFLTTQPRGILAEFPVPRADALPAHEPEYAYLSTFHWFPLVNGYSGNYPPSYLARIARLQGFPDEESITQLRRDNVRYVIVHGDFYPAAVWYPLRKRLDEDPDLVQLGRFDDGFGPAFLYRLR